MSTLVSPGDLIRIHFTMRTLEGSVIETSTGRDATELRLLDDEFIPAIQQGVIGMRVGEERTISAPPERAFGRHNPDLIQTTPRSLLPEDVQVGDQLTAMLGHEKIDFWVQRLTEHEAVVDANHPLAGESLTIDVRLIGHVPDQANGP